LGGEQWEEEQAAWHRTVRRDMGGCASYMEG